MTTRCRSSSGVVLDGAVASTARPEDRLGQRAGQRVLGVAPVGSEVVDAFQGERDGELLPPGRWPRGQHGRDPGADGPRIEPELSDGDPGPEDGQAAGVDRGALDLDQHRQRVDRRHVGELGLACPHRRGTTRRSRRRGVRPGPTRRAGESLSMAQTVSNSCTRVRLAPLVRRHQGIAAGLQGEGHQHPAGLAGEPGPQRQAGVRRGVSGPEGVSSGSGRSGHGMVRAGVSGVAVREGADHVQAAAPLVEEALGTERQVVGRGCRCRG